MPSKNGTMWKILFAVAGALITVGALCATINHNKTRIEKVEAVSSANKGDIRELKTDIKYIRSAVDDIKKEIKK